MKSQKNSESKRHRLDSRITPTFGANKYIFQHMHCFMMGSVFHVFGELSPQIFHFVFNIIFEFFPLNKIIESLLYSGIIINNEIQNTFLKTI